MRNRFRYTKLGKKASNLAVQVADVLNGATVRETKKHYVSSLRNWINFNLEFQEDPFNFPLDPNTVIFWIQDRFNAAGNIKSLNTWTATLHWISNVAGSECEYKRHPDYINYIAALKKQHKEGNDVRLPFTLKHIKKFAKAKWNNDKLTIQYKNLLHITLASIYFFTMSRPCELVASKQANNRLKGLTLGDFSRIFDKQNKIPMIRLTMHAFKNQKSRMIKKQIYFASANCKMKHKCICQQINPYDLLILLNKRRDILAQNLYRKIKEGDKNQIQIKQLTETYEKLRLKPKNPLFVKANGNPVNTSDITQIAKNITNINQIVNPRNYTAYSLRIGGTTRASVVGIEHPKILKYVGWTNSRLADCAQRYMRYAPHQLAIIPFQMIHKRREGKNTKIYDPWSERLDQKYYNPV